MDELVNYITQHTERGSCVCGKCIDAPSKAERPAGHTIDVVFFEVGQRGKPTARRLAQLVTENANKGEYGPFNAFDGGPHDFIEIGAWIGSQELALRLIGLGGLLHLWEVKTAPDSVAIHGISNWCPTPDCYQQISPTKQNEPSRTSSLG